MLIIQKIIAVKGRVMQTIADSNTVRKRRTARSGSRASDVSTCRRGTVQSQKNGLQGKKCGLM